MTERSMQPESGIGQDARTGPEPPTQRQSKGWAPWVAPLVVLILALGLRLYGLDSRSVWMDEDRQAGYSWLGVFEPSIVQWAATQQQPPLDYYLEALGIAVFGMNEWGIRIHAAMLSAGAVSLLFLTLRRLKAVPWLGAFLFALHPACVYYAQEGRPISCGVFFATLTLYALTLFFQSSLHWAYRFLFLSLAQSLFLLSVGFQPIVFLLCLGLTLGPALISRIHRRRILQVYGTMLVAGALAYPILQVSLRRPTFYATNESIPDMLSRIGQQFGLVAWKDFVGILGSAAGSYGILAGLALVFGCTQSGVRRLVFLGLALFVSLVPFVFLVFFQALIHYNLNARYTLTFVPAFLLALCFGISKATWNRWSKVLLLLALLWGLPSNLEALRQGYRAPKEEWNKLYRLFREQSQPGSQDIAWMLNLIPPDEWSPEFYATQFYYPAGSRPVRLNAKKTPKTQNLYLVTVYGAPKIQPDLFTDLPEIQVFNFHAISVAKIRIDGNLQLAYLRFLNRLAISLPPTEDNFLLYEKMFHLNLELGRLDSARLNLEALSRMNTRGKLDERILKARLRLDRATMTLD